MEKQIYNQIEAVIREAAKIMHEADSVRQMHIERKSGTANFVTEYDVKVQRFLEERLSLLLPGCAFLAEEEGEGENPLGDAYTFIIDPIDGTTNFMLGRRASCISVGLLENKEQIYGAVYDPYADRYYSAISGKGAFCNGEPIHVSDRAPSCAIASIGTAPYNRDTMAVPVSKIFYELLTSFGDVRRIGSAALEICAVACGELDVYCEAVLSPWDYAGATLILKEAGGISSDFYGNALQFEKPCSVIASSPKSFPTVLKIVEGKID